MAITVISFILGFYLWPLSVSYKNNINHGMPVNSKTLWLAFLGTGLLPSFCLKNCCFAFAVACFMTYAWCVQQSLYLQAFLLVLIILSCIDIQLRLLPDSLTLPLMWFAWFFGPLGLVAASSASAILISILLLVSQFYYWWRKCVGFGGGDIKLLAAVAAWCGLDKTMNILLIACLLGILYFFIKYIYTKISTKKITIPNNKSSLSIAFGPFITIAAIWQILL